MRSRRWIALVLGMAATAVLGQEPDPRESEERLASEVRLDAILLDNLFQAPEGAPQEDVAGGRVELRGLWHVDDAGRLDLHGRVGHTEYDSGLDATQNLGLGLRGGSGIHGWDLLGEYFNDRPSVETDVFDQADVTRFVGAYTIRPHPAWQVSVEGIVEQQAYERAANRDNDFSGLGAALRYRGFGRAFSPEIGYATGSRDVDREASSHDQDELFVRVISAPIEPLHLALRWRLRQREYTVGDPAASNFGREDDRTQWSLTGAWRSGPRLGWNLYLAREESESTRPGVEFETAIATFGVAWRLN